MSLKGPRLVVVSNRLPFVLKDNGKGQLERKPSVGGLVTAVAPVMIHGTGVWIGWPGPEYDGTQPIPESSPNDKTPAAGLTSEKIRAVHLPSDLFDSYYNGCCNNTFWPLFHCMPERANFSSVHWKAYTKVNTIFGEVTVNTLNKLGTGTKEDETTLVWLHDFHLMLCANTVRNLGKQGKQNFKLGFFLHIPFPPWDVFKLFPWANEVLQGLLGNDLVGFQTEGSCLNFIDCCYNCLGCRVDRVRMVLNYGGRTVVVKAFPIGIPYKRFETLARNAPPANLPAGLKIILGVDRLDYTKGIPQRLQAMEALFENFPEHIGKVALLQIVVPSRTDVQEYQDLKEEIELLVGRLNGKLSSPKWFPILYMYGGISQDELAGFYKESSIAFITPLRDGMNLVAKEFVVCQITEPPGVLIISPFAGAGETMHEALSCNPYEIEEAAKTLNRALTMPADERILRMNYLKSREKANDVDHWMRSYFKSVMEMTYHNLEKTDLLCPVMPEDFDAYLLKYMDRKKKTALLLDYDGTLSPLASHPDLAILPGEANTVLLKLVNHPDIIVSIISGRNIQNVKSKVGIDNIIYAGSHGQEIIYLDGTKFVYPMPPELTIKAAKLVKDLEEKVCRDGAWVENKGVYLTFHYRNTPEELRADMVTKAKKLIEEAGFKVGYAHLAIESKPKIDWNKGRASIHILQTLFGLDWGEKVRIIYAGDDATDEDAMEALKGMAVSFRVASTIVKTAADYQLPNPDSVIALLKWVEKFYSQCP